MQAGSTGLGKMTLKMRLSDKSLMTKLPPTEPPEGAIVMYCKTHDPVVWNVWIGIEPEDIPSMIRFALNPKILYFAIKGLFVVALSKLRPKKKESEQAMQRDAVQT